MGIVEDFGGRSRSSVCLQRRRSCSLPFSPFSVGSLSRLSISYQKLPSHHLCNLSVLKLDGSSFDIQTLGTATVAELKQAVEDLFSQSPTKDHSQISWSHVWSHFCLCFEGHKLINDKDYIQSFGIQDGCQLYFIQHLSINSASMKRLSKNRSSAYKQPKITLAGSDICEEEELCEGVTVSDVQAKNIKTYKSEDDSEDIIAYSEFKLSHFFKGWLSQIGLCCFRRSRTKRKVLPTRFSKNFLKFGSKLTFMRI